MNTAVATVILFVTCWILSLFYWHVIRETAIRGIRFRLFARRDKLRRLALDNKIDPLSFPYTELEKFMCKTISVVPSISLASLIVFIVRHPKASSETAERFRNEASEELVRLQEKTVLDALKVMMINSPILVAFGSIVVLLCWIAGQFNKMLVVQRAEQFVDTLPPAPREPVLQPA